MQVPWPETLPTPSASGFAFTQKKLGNTLAFASGRRRVTRTRTFDNFLFEVNMSFTFTLSEYEDFAIFYDANWKNFAPQKDQLQLSVAGYTWNGWPSSEVTFTVGDNVWQVAFSFECFAIMPPYSDFSSEESDPTSPLWPLSEFPLLEGGVFKRISRDTIALSDNLILSKTIVPDDNFVTGEISVRQAEFNRIFRILYWWIMYCKAGALAFRLPATALDLGTLNGVSFHNTSNLYKGWIVAPPKVTFDGLFGTAALSIVLCPYKTPIQSSKLLITDTGAWFKTTDSSHLKGS